MSEGSGEDPSGGAGEDVDTSRSAHGEDATSSVSAHEDGASEGYVHRPDGAPTAPPEREFGRSGWLLVAAIAVAFVVVPLVIYVRPPGLPFVVAYLALPLVPAVLLALLAVWVTTRG